MKHAINSKQSMLVFNLVAALCFSVNTHAADADAANTLAKANNCFACHAIDKQKVGPAWNAVAAKYKGDAQAQAKLVQHLTTGGATKSHMIIKADDPNDIKNLADWLLSL